jgi:hypothetical protein
MLATPTTAQAFGGPGTISTVPSALERVVTKNVWQKSSAKLTE